MIRKELIDFRIAKETPLKAITYRVLLSLSLLAGPVSCATLYPFDYYVLREGPIHVNSEWTEIYCPDVIETSRPDKELWLLLPLPLDVPNFHDRVVVSRRDGQIIEIFAEIVDTDGKVYALPVWLSRASIAGRLREGIYMRLANPELPRSINLTTVRLRSSVPITLAEVLWIDSRSIPPPTPGPLNGRF